MKAVFKFTIIALGLAAIALSIIAITNHCKNRSICCDDDFDDLGDFD
jgi:hypothetical protein